MRNALVPLLTELLKTFNLINCKINQLEDLIMNTQEEAAQALAVLNDKLTAMESQLEKVALEVKSATGSQLTAIAALQEQLAAAGAVSPELQAALDNLEATSGALSVAAQALDDINPDATA